MATLQTIRNRGGLLVSIVIGLALIAFIVGDALNSGSRIFNSQRNQIGEIAGEGVSIIDFQNRVSKNEEMIKAMNNVSSLNEEQQTMLRENTWQQMIMEQLMQREYDEIGIDVSGDEFENSLGVIIQTADDLRVDAVVDVQGFQIFLQFFKVCAAVVAEIVQNDRSIFGDSGTDRALAVQNPHGVLFQTGLAGFAEFLFFRFEVSFQSLVILRTADRAADGVDVEGNIL